QFTNSSEDPDTTQREIEVKVTDGRGLESETATSLINVIPVADITVTSDSIGAEDSRIELDIDIPLGSSITQLEVSEIPPGAELYVDGEKVAITDGKAVFDANSLTKVEVKPKADSDVDFSVKVQGLDDNGDSVEQSHDVNVEVTPVADEPSLFVSNPTILASNNFEQVDLGRRSWRGNVSDEELNGGDSVGKWATDEDTGRGEVGKEGVYLGGRDQNKLFELEGGRQDNTLSTEFDAKAGNFYLISFDISARRVGSSPATLFLVSESGERTEIFDYETQVQGWSTQQVTFETPEEGTYTLVFESNQTDTYGALLDNIELTTVDNYGYEDSFINISDLVVGASRDTDGSEELTVILENLPKGTIVRTVGEDEITVGEDGIADISGWDDLVNLQIKFSEPSPEGEPYPVTVTVTSSEMDPNFPDESRTVSETINVTVVEIPPVVTEVSSLSVSEGDEAIFDVTLSNETRLETPITMTLTDGTASSDSDYTATSVVVTYFVDNVETTVTVDVDPTTGEFGFKLPANNDGFRVSVETTDDNNAPVFEGNETFVLNVATQAQDIERSGEATIQDGGENDGDNDRPVIESISDIQVEEGNTATFTVELSNESTTQTLVRLKYTDSSATAPEDYGSAESVTIKYGDPEETVSANVENGRFTVNIPAGVTSFDVLVDTQDDLHIDDNEQFALSARTDAQSGYVNGI
ncbi:Calx-beta domain-containing protein, partial [Vibrio amylolyticus]|uniref:Calx-beta domain-containing protein n=1 Tax=Vibrio amylolyticus TaxID=2847292 RepID=UPI00354C8295